MIRRRFARGLLRLTRDTDRIREFYADKHGIKPALRTEPRLLDEDADA